MNVYEILSHINPATLNYEEWLKVGMALKHEGYSVSVWEDWSRADGKRFHAGECADKWASFREEKNEIVTMGTVVEMAKRNGYIPQAKDERALDWNDTLTCGKDAKNGKIIDKNWLEYQEEITEPKDAEWNGVKDLITYLETLFLPTDFIGFCMESKKITENGKDKFVPVNKGIFTRTAGDIIHDLRRYKTAVIGSALGDYNQECGAWIRINPLDGKDVKDKNVTDYKFALVESDAGTIETQYTLIKELQLPVAALVHSGNKSLHAIVKIDAKDFREYRKRVDFLYEICQNNGLVLDKQNRNPSRLSRMPGVMRAGKKQWLIASNIGKKNWAEWEEWQAEQMDDLPNFENLSDVWDNLPELSPSLIDGILRQGHKMLISGASKAGKSFAQIEMAIAIAEGEKWLGWQCAQGKVVYVNFELDRASCLHRFKDVYTALKIPPNNIGNISIWNLRGKSMQLDKLAPKLIRRAKKTEPIAVILDPIYKALTGDENSAEQMAIFCNQFDKICAEIGSSVIYCHHHSKGAQGGKKAMDRASGSGVFARDPDALLDLIELPLKESHYEMLKNKAACRAIIDFFDVRQGKEWRQDLGADDFLSKAQMMNYAKGKLTLAADIAALESAVAAAEKHAGHISAWRIEATLREYEKPDDRNVYFAWPVHLVDESGALSDIRPEIEVGGRIVQPRDKSDGSAKRDKAKQERQQIIDAYEMIAASKEPDENGEVTVTIQDFVEQAEEYFGKELSKPAIRKKINKFGDYTVKNGVITIADDADDDD